MSSRKIFNDPVYGFVAIPNDLIFQVIEHPYFQRLRRIKQLGLTDLVYPGALHTRFQHAIGAMYLMSKTLDSLRAKGHMIFDSEYEGALIAILLHDLGHGPFSHTLEFSLFKNVRHEEVTSWALRRLNKEFHGRLDIAIQIFEGKYPRKFLTELVSSQLDMDRLDYLKRDCYFTGVVEGAVGSERIIKMLNLVDDQLVIEEKGIYSIESFLNARRIMYWQVYLHKTSICAERTLMLIIKRARKLTNSGQTVNATPSLRLFLERSISEEDFLEDQELLDVFMQMDDNDVWGSIKYWVNHEDRILSELSKMLLYRKLFKIKLYNSPPDEDLAVAKKAVQSKYKMNEEESEYFTSMGSVTNTAYLPSALNIKVLMKNGDVKSLTEVADLTNIEALSKIVHKHYLCWPKEITLG